MTKTATSAVADEVRHFDGRRRRVYVRDEALGVWDAERQRQSHAAESFGVLVGTTSVDKKEVWIEAVTTPMPLDRRSRFWFELRDPGHQHVVCEMFERSGGKRIYLGTWHTHPEPRPTASMVDKKDWQACQKANRGRPLAFVLVGTEEIRFFCRARGRFGELRAGV